MTIIAAFAAWSSRETFRIRLNDLGEPDAVPIEKGDYEKLRAQTMADTKKARA